MGYCTCRTADLVTSNVLKHYSMREDKKMDIVLMNLMGLMRLAIYPLYKLLNYFDA